MSVELQTTESIDNTVIDMGVPDRIVAGLKGRLAGLEANTPAGYEAVKAGISEVRTYRTGVEKSRKELKASALEYGRKVDAEAKRVTNLLLEIEEPLKERKAAVDEAIDREKLARQQEALAKIEAEERKAREVAEAAERAERARKRAQIEAEQKAEQERLAAEQRKQAEEASKLKAERDEIDAERRKLEAEKRAMQEGKKAEERAAELAKRQAIQEREEKRRVEELAKREKKEAETAKLKAEADRKEADRQMEERKPDVEKLADIAGELLKIAKRQPRFKTDWAKKLHAAAMIVVRGAAESLK